MAEPDHDRKRKALSDIYGEHHRAGDRIGFTFGGPERARQFTQWIGTGKDILDLGCRDGTLTRHFAEGNHVTGVDVDKEALRLCEQNLGIETRWVDVGSGLPFDDQSFDVVVASETLEHLPWPNLVVAEVARVLQSQGVFVGSLPNAFRLKNRLRFLLGREYEDDPTHLRHFSEAGLRALLDPHFSVIQIKPVVGRLAWLSGPLFANTLMWRCEKM